MTERNFSLNEKWWVGQVIDVNDPDKEGRVQVRIHGIHDDYGNIPDKSLFWAKPTMPVTSAGHNKMGITPVGLVKGSTVMGMFLDKDFQYPMMIASIAKAGDASDTETAGGSEALKDGTNSTPPGNRKPDNTVITRAD